MLPVVAIVGRPNVGKSTLFNRLMGKKLALVDDQPGVTRDRREGDVSLLGLDFRLVDTAGYEDEDANSLPGRMRMQTEAAVEDCDVALFVIDARAGITPLDEEIARWLRANDAPVILLANKAEGKAADDGVMESFSLGLGEPIPFSAEHGQGLADLFGAIVLGDVAQRQDAGEIAGVVQHDQATDLVVGHLGGGVGQDVVLLHAQDFAVRHRVRDGAVEAAAFGDHAQDDVAVGDQADDLAVLDHRHHAAVDLGHGLGDLANAVGGAGDRDLAGHGFADFHGETSWVGIPRL